MLTLVKMGSHDLHNNGLPKVFTITWAVPAGQMAQKYMNLM